jgi:hypothetical protein
MAQDQQTSSEQPAPPPPPDMSSSAAIFRQALAQNAEIHRRALNELQQYTDDVHAQLRQMTSNRIQALQVQNFQLVRRAAVLDPDFWEDTVNRAIGVLQQHGEFPADPEPADEEDGE